MDQIKKMTLHFDLVLGGDSKEMKKAIRGLGKRVLKGVPEDPYDGLIYFSRVPLGPSETDHRAYLHGIAERLDSYKHLCYMLTSPNNDSKHSFYRIFKNSKGEVKVTKKATRRRSFR